ncbi:hypothetical protein MNBD_GAMMA03-1276, partial [hydrothermal vent metagenome]
MKFSHIGIPVTGSFEGEIDLPHLKMTVSDHENNPYGIQWQRYWDDAPYPELVKFVPHVAFVVKNLEEEILGKNVIIEPNSPSEGLIVAFIEVNGAPAIPAGNFSRRDKLKTFRKDFTLLSDASRRYEPKFATNLAGMADTNANLTTNGTNTYTYDETNRLKTFSNGTTSAAYQYDAFNRRTSKTVNGNTTYFIYDGDEVIAEYNGSNALQAEYVMGDNIDEILTMER